MGQDERVQDFYTDDEFQDLLDEAEGNAANDFETEFMTTMVSKWEEYGKRMYISPKQREILERIAGE